MRKQPLERLIPANHSLIEPDDEQPIVQRFEDVFVERAETIELGGLEMQLMIEASVLDGRCSLAGDRGEQRHVFARERLATFAAAERERRDSRPVRHTRHEVVDPGITPELDLLDRKPPDGKRIVQPDDTAGRQASANAGCGIQARQAAFEADVLQLFKLVELVGKHQGQPIDVERFLDA